MMQLQHKEATTIHQKGENGKVGSIMLTRFHHQSDGKGDSQKDGRGKNDSGAVVAMMTTLQQLQSLDGGLLIIIWSAGLGRAGK